MSHPYNRTKKFSYTNNIKFSQSQTKHTGTPQKGTVLSCKGYLRSVIMSSPTNRWKGSIMFRPRSKPARSTSINQSCLWIFKTWTPWDLMVWAPSWISGIFTLNKIHKKIVGQKFNYLQLIQFTKWTCHCSLKPPSKSSFFLSLSLSLFLSFFSFLFFSLHVLFNKNPYQMAYQKRKKSKEYDKDNSKLWILQSKTEEAGNFYQTKYSKLTENSAKLLSFLIKFIR